MNIFAIEDLLECIRKFPQGSVIYTGEITVVTPNMYCGNNKFNVFDTHLPNWSNPDTDEDF